MGWSIVQQLLEPLSGKPLPTIPRAGLTSLCKVTEIGEESLLVVRETAPETILELHTHGGVQVTDWVRERCLQLGCSEAKSEPAPASTLDLLPQATTLRLARLILDQLNGALPTRIREILKDLDASRWANVEKALHRLIAVSSLRKYTTEPFRVVLVGAPNVGKSSLLNAMAGFQRSIVAPQPGTTRDAVSLQVALDGWLVELTDTAGIRDTQDSLEIEGIERTKFQLSQADLSLWIFDSTTQPFGPTLRLVEKLGLNRHSLLFIINKCDQRPTWDVRELPQAQAISATMGKGITQLVERILRRLIPVMPMPGEAVPLWESEIAVLREALNCCGQQDANGLRKSLESLLEG